MEPIGIADAARQLEVSPRRVHQLVAAGQLSGHRIGRSWVLDRVGVQRFARSRPEAVRPWRASSAWNVLAMANGDDVQVSPVDRSRARKRLQSGLEPLASRLSSRAQNRWFYGHPAVHSEVLSHPGVAASGVSALSDHRVDLVVSDDDWPFEAGQRVAPAPVVAVDLLEADDERSQRAAREFLARSWTTAPMH